jgi:polyhydroxyalkanoate synthesis repressor PhaR
MTRPARIIKKYPNRRLYDTEKSAYITLAEVKQMVIEQEQFRVVDTKTNEDLTREILLQIILEEESSAAPIFSSDMLTQMIRSYGGAMQGVMGTYLDRSIHSFLEAQQKLQDQFRNVYGENASMSGERWAQFLSAQMPAMQSLMGSYLEQSANMFMGLQQRVEEQTRQFFGALQPGATQAPDEEPKVDPAPSAKGKRGSRGAK